MGEAVRALELEDMAERQAYLHQGRGVRDLPGTEFAGVSFTGSLKEWILAQEEACGRPFRPTKIQQFAMSRIYEGECVVLQSPTGTGKTLAYLLPLLQRLQDEPREMPASQLRLLVLVPTADLQVQVTAAIRSLVGPGRSAAVGALRRDVDGAAIGSEAGSRFAVPYAVAVATPKLVLELMEHPSRGQAWRNAVSQIDALVVDEADAFKRQRRYERRQMYLKGDMEPCTRLMQNIRNWTARAGRGDQWQLVASSATVNRQVDRSLRFDSGIDLSYIRASGGGGEEEALPRMGKPGESKDGTLFPKGLQHTMRIVDEWNFATVLGAVRKTVRELDANRVLIVIAGESADRPDMTIGLNPAVAYLRSELEERGFEVSDSSTAVKVAAAAFADGGMGERFTPLGRKPAKQVIIATLQVIRGIHIDDIDAVILVGHPGTPTEYVHVAGRTCRRIPGLEEDDVKAGIVVSVVRDELAGRLIEWSDFLGFKTYEVPLSNEHQSIAQIRGDPNAGRAEPLDDFDESVFDDVDRYFQPSNPQEKNDGVQSGRGFGTGRGFGDDEWEEDIDGGWPSDSQDNSDGANSGRGFGNGRGFGDQDWAEDIYGAFDDDEDSDEDKAEQNVRMEKPEPPQRIAPYPPSAGYQGKRPVQGLKGRPPKPGDIPKHVSERVRSVAGSAVRPRKKLDLSDPKFFAEEVARRDREFAARGQRGRAARARPAGGAPGAGRPTRPGAEEPAEEAPTAASGGAWT